MYKELQKDYGRKLSWARSLGIGAAENFLCYLNVMQFHLDHLA